MFLLFISSLLFFNPDFMMRGQPRLDNSEWGKNGTRSGYHVGECMGVHAKNNQNFIILGPAHLPVRLQWHGSDVARVRMNRFMGEIYSYFNLKFFPDVLVSWLPILMRADNHAWTTRSGVKWT